MIDSLGALSVHSEGVLQGRDEAAEIVKTAFTSLPAGTTMATKDMLLDIYNEIKGTTDGTLQEEG